MKPLPVIQPEPPASTAPAEQKTTALVRDEARTTALEPAILAAIRTVFDPEIPVNIYDLGLIYNLDIDGDGRVDIQMTLTTPGCPVAAERVVPPRRPRRMLEGAEVPRPLVVVEDDFLVQLAEVRHQPKTSRTLWRPRTNTSTSSRVL